MMEYANGERSTFDDECIEYEIRFFFLFYLRSFHIGDMRQFARA